MTSDIFRTWLGNLDRSMTVQGRKILMIVDNCPAHPKVEGLRSIELHFLPPNCTSGLQPMDQGIIRLLKVHYRKLSLKMILDEIDKTGTRPDEKLNVLQAMEFIRKAWNAVGSDAIHNCFLHGFDHPVIGNQEEATAVDELRTMIERECDTAEPYPTAGKHPNDLFVLAILLFLSRSYRFCNQEDHSAFVQLHGRQYSSIDFSLAA